MKKILLHLGIIIIASIFVVWLSMEWLNVWTRHDATLTVPSVKSLDYPEAAARLEEKGLVAVLSDSVYDKGTRPGNVIEQNPKAGTVVKEGREIYLTINAFSPKMVTLPALTDISVRQARSILEGLEIHNIIERRVPSEFKDLVISVRYKGTRISPGARVPVNAPIELEVGEGMPDFNNDTISNGAQGVEQLDIFS